PGGGNRGCGPRRARSAQAVRPHPPGEAAGRARGWAGARRRAYARAVEPVGLKKRWPSLSPWAYAAGSPMSSIANFLRGTDKEFFDLFERAGKNLARAAQLLDEMLADYPERRALAQDILGCEGDGDQITHEIIRRLNQTFVTPIDRED